MSRQSTNFGPYEREYRERVPRSRQWLALALQAGLMAAAVTTAGVFVFPMERQAQAAVVQNQPAGSTPFQQRKIAMSKALRLAEKWFRRGLWVVAFVFASFLVGLGSTVVGDLPRVEHRIELDDFIDRAAADPLRTTVREAERSEQQAGREREQAELRLVAAQQASRAARETFGNWLATRRATAQPDQDTELIARTRALDALKAKEDEAERGVVAQRQIALDARQSRQRAQQQLALLEEEARKRLEAENRKVELRVFLYRLALTLPLLVVAGWLFAKKRKSTWWPFVWGFIYFALFAFFVELVPYLPSYGGYVR